MIIIKTHKKFEKSLKKRVNPQTSLATKLTERILLFQKTPNHSILKDHALSGDKLGLRAFSITGDVRIVYKQVNASTVQFFDIGTHNQVY